MQALKLPALAGLIWVSAGYRLMLQQFLRLFSVVIIYFFAFLLVMTLAVILTDALTPLGVDANIVQRSVWFLAGAFSPTLSIGFMEACRSITRGERVSPTYFFRGFRLGRAALLSLLGLGLFQVASLTVIASFMPKTPDMSLEDMMKSLSAPNPPLDTHDSTLQLLLLVPMFLVIAALWYAPMLAAWHGMRPVKAMFFSLAACWRNKTPFIMFAMGWFLVFIFLSTIGTVLYSVLGANGVSGTLVAMLVMVTLGAMYCSIYVSYSTVFVATPAAAPLEQKQI